MPAPRSSKPWKDMSHVWPLLKKPGEHIDPGRANFGIRVSPRGKCVWWAAWSNGTGKQRKSKSTTLGLVQPEYGVADGSRILDLAQALDTAREWTTEQSDPEYAERRRKEREAARARPLTMGEAYDTYKRQRRTKRGMPLAEATTDGYDKTWNVHFAEAKDWPVVSTGPDKWSKFIEDIGKKSPSAAMAAMAIASGIYDHQELLELEGLTRNPIRKVRKMRLVQKPAARTTHAEVVNLPALVRGIMDLRNKASRDVLLVCLLGGFRRTAACRLRRSIIDMDRRIIQVPIQEPGWKSWTGMYPINRHVFEILQARDQHPMPESDWFFPARHGVQEHIGDVRGSLENACKNLPKTLAPQDLRRTFGTICDLIYPGDVVIAGKLLAHKWALPDNPEVSITLRYQVHTIEELRYASEMVAGAILQIAGIEPMSAETAAALKRKNVSPESLALVEIEGDE